MIGFQKLAGLALAGTLATSAAAATRTADNPGGAATAPTAAAAATAPAGDSSASVPGRRGKAEARAASSRKPRSRTLASESLSSLLTDDSPATPVRLFHEKAAAVTTAPATASLASPAVATANAITFAQPKAVATTFDTTAYFPAAENPPTPATAVKVPDISAEQSTMSLLSLSPVSETTAPATASLVGSSLSGTGSPFTTSTLGATSYFDPNSLPPIPTGSIALDALPSTTSTYDITGLTSSPMESPGAARNIALPDIADFERRLNTKIDRKERIDLNGVVVRAVCRNLNIRLSDVESRIAADEFVAQQGIFDLRISGISQVIHTEPVSGSVTGSSSSTATGTGATADTSTVATSTGTGSTAATSTGSSTTPGTTVASSSNSSNGSTAASTGANAVVGSGLATGSGSQSSTSVGTGVNSPSSTAGSAGTVGGSVTGTSTGTGTATTAANSGTGSTSTGTGSTIGSNVSRTFQNQVTVGQLLPTGGIIELLFDTTQLNSSALGDASPQNTSQIGLQLTQPLLKNGGPLVTQSRIVLADFDSKISASQFRQQVLAQVSLAIQQYYELIFAVSNVDVLRISLAQAEELLRVNRAKFEAGVLPELDVLQAQADVASRQQDLVVALQQVEAQSDLLKTQLAEIDSDRARRTSLRPADAPGVPSYPLRERAFLDEAFAFRPEIEQATYDIEKQGINVRVALNQTLPQLDAFAGYTATGARGSTFDSIRKAADNDSNNYKFGVQFNYPLQNREARFRFHQAEKRVDQAFIRIQQLRNSVTLDVRNSVRSVETTREQIAVGRATVEFNRAKVETARQRQDVGLATSFDVLAFQRDLANARSALLRSVVDYNKSIVVLEESKGTLLESLGIQVCDGVVLENGKKPKKALGISR